jgi:hypothetical protein
MKALAPVPRQVGIAELTYRESAYRYTGKEKVKAGDTAGTLTQCVLFLAHSISRVGPVVFARSLRCPFDRRCPLAARIAFAAPQLPFKVEYVRVGRQP